MPLPCLLPAWNVARGTSVAFSWDAVLPTKFWRRRYGYLGVDSTGSHRWRDRKGDHAGQGSGRGHRHDSHWNRRCIPWGIPRESRHRHRVEWILTLEHSSRGTRCIAVTVDLSSHDARTYDHNNALTLTC